jgi:hypothetical protein
MKVILTGINGDEEMQRNINDLDNEEITINNPGSRNASLEFTEKKFVKEVRDLIYRIYGIKIEN